MRLDYSTTKNRINKIKEVLNRPGSVNMKELAQKCNLPETTTSLYIQEYLKDICVTFKVGREKKVFLMKNKISLFEKDKEKQRSKIDLAIKLRKKGLSYSEIKHELNIRGFNISDGILKEILKDVSIKGKYKDRYRMNIRRKRIKAGKIGGKIRASMKNFKNIQILSKIVITKKAFERIPKSSKLLTLEKINIIGHCIFDGGITPIRDPKVIFYVNKSLFLLNEFKNNMEKVYGLKLKDIKDKGDKVFLIRYCSIAAAKDICNLIKGGIPTKIINGIYEEKIIFLKTFWDDEGAVHFGITKDNKGYYHISIYVEAFCEDNIIRKQMIDMHESIGFPIKEWGKKIRISKKENLIKFQNEINFSPKIYISYPLSKFNGWEKRKLLDYGLKFKAENASSLYRDLWLQ